MPQLKPKMKSGSRIMLTTAPETVAAMAKRGLPPNMVRMGSSKTREAAVTTRLTMMQRMTEQPMLRWASSCAPEPRLMLTKAQQPSPIMTASASATTVSGKTTVLAALP